MKTRKKSSTKNSIIAGVLVLIVAFGLTVLSYAIIPGSTTKVDDSGCLITDCVSGIETRGFPIQHVEVQKSDGLNCDNGSHRVSSGPNYCSSSEFGGLLAAAPNFMFYLIMVSLVALIFKKLTENNR